MSNLLKLKPNCVRIFDDLTFGATIAHRELRAVDKIVDTALQEIENADLSDTKLNKVTALYWTLCRRAEALRAETNQQLELIRAAIELRQQPEMVSIH